MKKSLLYIGNRLQQERYNATIIDKLGDLLETEGFNLHYASSNPDKILRLLDMLWTCFKLRNKVDFVLLDTYSTLNFYYAYLVSQLSRLLKISYVPILHGGNLPQRLKNNPKLSLSIFKYAYRNVAPSIYIKNAFESYGYSKIEFIPNTIEIDNYSFKHRTINQINLLWVRSFSKIYNPELAVQVLKALQDEGYDVSLCMIGPDSDGSLEEVKTLASQLQVDVKFTGKLTKAEWISLSEDYNVFINTTNFDNMPVSVIEAMALGLPIVSTNVGGMPYLIEDNVDGLLVEPNNVESMVNAIIKLKNDSNLVTTISKNARTKVEQYNWEVVKHLWFKLLN